MELESGEELIWKGRLAYHLRYPFLAFMSLFGILNINGASLGDAVDAASTILFFGFLVASLVSIIVDKGRKYYLTNRRGNCAQLYSAGSEFVKCPHGTI